MKENGSIVKHFCDAAALDDEPVCKPFDGTTAAEMRQAIVAHLRTHGGYVIVSSVMSLLDAHQSTARRVLHSCVRQGLLVPKTVAFLGNKVRTEYRLADSAKASASRALAAEGLREHVLGIHRQQPLHALLAGVRL